MILDQPSPLAVPLHLVFRGIFGCAGTQRGHRVQQGVLRRLAEQSQEHGHTKTSGSLPLSTIHTDRLLTVLGEICIISVHAQSILTTWTGEAMSTCTQMPGQSKPRWEPMKRPAQELCAFSRSCRHTICTTVHSNQITIKMNRNLSLVVTNWKFQFRKH